MCKLVGYEKEKRDISQIKNMLLHAEEYKAKGVRIPRGLILFGEPGCGKSQLVSDFAHDDISIYNVCALGGSGYDVQSKLSEAFQNAVEMQPSIVVIEEFDKLANVNDPFNDGISAAEQALLQEIDALSSEDNVLVVLTCNDISSLSKALLRPGRFDRKIHIDLPDENTRELILKDYFSKILIPQEIDFKYLARIIPGFSGAKIECLANEVGIEALSNGIDAITVENVRKVINRMAFAGHEKNPVEDAEKLRMIAVHEAGHAIVALHLMPDNIFSASILPQGNSNGHVHYISKDDGVCTVEDLENEVCVLLGGHVAEKEELGQYLVGSSHDIMSATSRIKYLAQVEAAYGYEGVVEAAFETFPTKDMEFWHTSFRKVRDVLNSCESKVEGILYLKREAFRRIVDELVKKQTLTGEELLAIYDGETADSAA